MVLLAVAKPGGSAHIPARVNTGPHNKLCLSQFRTGRPRRSERPVSRVPLPPFGGTFERNLSRLT
jgi:hypothetical protein